MNMITDRTARRSGTILGTGSSEKETSASDKGFTTGENTKPNFVQVRRDKNNHRWQLLDKSSAPLARIEVGILKNVSYATSEDRVPHGCTPGEYSGMASGLLLSQNDPEYREVMGRVFEGRRVRFNTGRGYFWDNISRGTDYNAGEGRIDSVKYLILLKDGSAVHILQ